MHASLFTAPVLGLLALVPLAGGDLRKLLAPDGEAGDLFGAAVAVDGQRLLAGAPGDADNGAASGSAYLFDVASGDPLAKLLPSGGMQGDRFGTRVALGASVAAVADRNDPTGMLAGRVTLFDLGSLQQTAVLTPSDPNPGDWFGRGLAIDGDTLLVGAPRNDSSGAFSGAAYVFDLPSGVQREKLLANDGSTLDGFGYAVALDGDLGLIGAPSHQISAERCGAAYLFDVRTGAQLARFLPSDGGCDETFGRQFGKALALAWPLAVVGAPYDDSQGPTAGSVYLFDAATGQERAKLTAAPGELVSQFGSAVAVRDRTVLVKASVSDNGGVEGDVYGVVYLFDAVTGERIGRRTLGDPQLDDFGFSLATAGGVAAGGDTLDLENGASAGAVYLFDPLATTALPYCFGDGSATPCPCGNAGGPGRGCANSASADGARLRSSGSACASDDDLALEVTGSAPLAPGLFFQGSRASALGAGAPFGDGLRCAGGSVRRLEAASADAAGAATSATPLALAGGAAGGDVLRYQWWYRDPGVSPCGAGFNLSNGLEVTWGP